MEGPNYALGGQGCRFLMEDGVFDDWNSRASISSRVELTEDADADKVEASFCGCFELTKLIYNFVIALFLYLFKRCCSSDSSSEEEKVSKEKDPGGKMLIERQVSIAQNNPSSTPLRETLFVRAYLAHIESLQNGISMSDDVNAREIYKARIEQSLAGRKVSIISLVKDVDGEITYGRFTVKVDDHEIYETIKHFKHESNFKFVGTPEKQKALEETPLTWTASGIEKHLNEGKSVSLARDSSGYDWGSAFDFRRYEEERTYEAEEEKKMIVVQGVLKALDIEFSNDRQGQLINAIKSFIKLDSFTRAVSLNIVDGQLYVEAKASDLLFKKGIKHDGIRTYFDSLHSSDILEFCSAEKSDFDADRFDIRAKISLD